MSPIHLALPPPAVDNADVRVRQGEAGGEVLEAWLEPQASFCGYVVLLVLS